VWQLGPDWAALLHSALSPSKPSTEAWPSY
jgi:hypothetical protein